MSRPLCRYCGGLIPKRTKTVYFAQSCDRRDDYSVSLTAAPRTREEAQRLVNGEIVSLRWSDEHGERRAGHRHVARLAVWDGEAYTDQFFCKGECAARFGYVMARGDHCTKAYNDALRARGWAA